VDEAGAAARERAESATAHQATERLTFFSDAVIAIAITLLAIELPVPEVGSVEALAESVGANGYEYLAFLISFAVIGNHWTIHHGVFRYVHRADGRAVRLNLAWLLVIVATPFLTKVAADGQGVLSFAFYAVPQALQTLLMAWLIHEIARHGWFEPDAPPSLTVRGHLRSLYFAAAFLISVPAYLLIGPWAFAIWWLVPVVLAIATRRYLEADD
jgi:uncharacterized membrane protein